MIKISRIPSGLVPIMLLGALGACSDSHDNRGSAVVPPIPPPEEEIISIDDSQSEFCDLLDSAKCLYPFPSNFFTQQNGATDTGLRINFDERAMPANVEGSIVDPTDWNRNDGFSPGTAMVTKVPGIDMEQTGAPRLIDLSESRMEDSPIVVINAETGERQLLWSELDANAEIDSEQSLLIRLGKNLQDGQRYIVVLRNLKDVNGDALAPTELFRAYRDDIKTDSDAAEARRPAMEDIFSALGNAGIARDDLYLAWDFTVASTRSISERILHMRDEAFAALAGGAPEFTIDSIEELSDVHENWGRRIEGTITVPNFMDSDDGGPGSALNYGDGSDFLPDRLNGDNTLTQPFVCNIPQISLENASSMSVSARSATRPYLYGHGLLGDRGESQSSSHQAPLANAHNLMNCAVDWLGMSEEDVPNAIALLQDSSSFGTLPDRTQQGFIGFMYLAELLRHEGGFSAQEAFQYEGVSLYDNSRVYYYGNSQGALLGGALVATAHNIEAGVLGVASMNYSLVLRRSVDFDLYAAFMRPAYPDVMDQTILLSLYQMLWDRGEVNGYANHIISDPLPGTPAKNLLVHVALGDHQVSNISAEIMARTMGMPLHQPALVEGRHHDINPFVELEAISTYPHMGSALIYFDSGPGPNDVWDDTGVHVLPVENIPPRAGNDPHERPRRDSGAWKQISEFMNPGDTVINTCGPGPCVIDGWNGVVE